MIPMITQTSSIKASPWGVPPPWWIPININLPGICSWVSHHNTSGSREQNFWWQNWHGKTLVQWSMEKGKFTLWYHVLPIQHKVDSVILAIYYQFLSRRAASITEFRILNPKLPEIRPKSHTTLLILQHLGSVKVTSTMGPMDVGKEI